ncbi:hypothetical protein BJV77DRAFT_961818 [Russula vinacea]|nr:hypothetical protein BJV77DRAFT_961818 [Russula vinacea]
MGNKTPNRHLRHVTGTKCRPDITAAFEKDWIMDDYTDWTLIRLTGERASEGKSREIQRKNAATYLHYLLLARPDFLVAQGLLITMRSVMFLVGTGGVSIQQLKVNWKTKTFTNPSYVRTGFNKETSEASYTVDFSTKKFSGFRTIHAKTPFTTRTHVLSKDSNPSLTQGANRSLTVIKEQLCRTGRHFDELTILTKIHQPVNVPGVVQAIGGEIIPAPLSPGREKHRLGLQQMGSPFTSIPTAQLMLETLFDLLEVLRFLCFKHRVLHRNVSIGNIMYIENPEIPAQQAVEPLIFSKYLLGDSNVTHETSLLLVDFNLGEDLEYKKHEKCTERTGTPIFMSQAVEQGKPVPLIIPYGALFHYVPKEEVKELVDPFKLKNQSQDNGWKHELDHDVESVFWLLLYWAMVAQPEGRPGEYINSIYWTAMLGDFKDREHLVLWFSSGDRPNNLTHSVYAPLWPLITSLAATLVGGAISSTVNYSEPGMG